MYIQFLDQSERSIKHVCTTALLCPFYRFLTGTSAISAQLVGSILGFIINMILAMGIIHQAASLLLIWLVSYAFYVMSFSTLTKIYTLHSITIYILCIQLQVGYVVGICGCIILFGIILNALLVRQQEDNDVSLTSLIVWPAMSLLLGSVYMLLWFIVFKAWKKIRRRARHNQVFTIFT